MKPVADQRPKVLVDVAGRPLIVRLLERLEDEGVARAVLVVSDQQGPIRQALGDRFGDQLGDLHLEYAVQPRPLGYGDAILRAEPLISGSFLELPGDVLVAPGNIRRAIELHRETPDAIVTLLRRVDRATARQTAVFEFQDGEITGAREKPDDPPSDATPGGFFILPDALFEVGREIERSHTQEYELTDAVDRLIDRDYPVRHGPYRGAFVNVNTPEDLRRAERLVERDRL